MATQNMLNSPTSAAITCTTTNDSASAGHLGQYVSSIIPFASAVTMVSSTATDMTSISLAAGDWDCDGLLTFTNLGTGVNGLLGWISSTSATLPDVSLRVGINATGMTANFSIAIPRIRFSLSTTTTIYISGYLSNVSGNGAACGYLTARRPR